MLWLWTYVIIATYVAKLVPFYAGFMTGRAHLSDMMQWWGHLLRGAWGTLDTIAFFPPGLLITLTLANALLAIILAVGLSKLLCLDGVYDWRVRESRPI